MGLSMSTPTGTSWEAKLDGKEYPVKGIYANETVSLKKLGVSFAKNRSHRFSGCTTHATSQSSSAWYWKSNQWQKASNPRSCGQPLPRWPIDSA
jgi:hypothetical protein